MPKVVLIATALSRAVGQVGSRARRPGDRPKVACRPRARWLRQPQGLLRVSRNARIRRRNDPRHRAGGARTQAAGDRPRRRKVRPPSRVLHGSARGPRRACTGQPQRRGGRPPRAHRGRAARGTYAVRGRDADGSSPAACFRREHCRTPVQSTRSAGSRTGSALASEASIVSRSRYSRRRTSAGSLVAGGVQSSPTTERSETVIGTSIVLPVSVDGKPFFGRLREVGTGAVLRVGLGAGAGPRGRASWMTGHLVMPGQANVVTPVRGEVGFQPACELLPNAPHFGRNDAGRSVARSTFVRIAVRNETRMERA